MFDNNSFRNPVFICPNCGIKTGHELYVQVNEGGIVDNGNLRIVKALCFSCGKYSIFLEKINPIIANSKKELKKFSIAWHGVNEYEMTDSRIPALKLIDQKVIYPDVPFGLPKPNEDMPDSVIEIYNEAASIANKSPRAAAALLRLALERLLEALGQTDGSLYTRIGNLYETTPQDIIDIMDIIRITGNNGIHDGDIGVINIDDKNDKENVLVLFKFINLLTDEFITRPQQLTDITSNFSQGEQHSIERRNNQNNQ